MSYVWQVSPESIIDRTREQLIAKVVAGTADPKDRARIEELSSARAALMKRRIVQRAARRKRMVSKRPAHSL